MDAQVRQVVLAEIEADIARLEGEIAELQRFRAYITRTRIDTPTPAHLPTNGHTRVGLLPATTPSPVHQTSRGSEVQGSVFISPRKATWRELVELVFREHGSGTALRAVEIVETLVERFGVLPREGRALERKIYTIMFRRPDLFVNLGNGHWSLAEYFPEEAKVWAAKRAGEPEAPSETDDDTDSDLEESR